MIKWALKRAIGKFEREWKYDASYMRELIDVSPRAAWLFSRVTALGKFRRDVPGEAWYAAGITAVRHEDCGPCTQLAVTMAERAGISPAVLRAVLAEDDAALSRIDVQRGPVHLLIERGADGVHVQPLSELAWHFSIALTQQPLWQAFEALPAAQLPAIHAVLAEHLARGRTRATDVGQRQPPLLCEQPGVVGVRAPT